MTSSAANAKPVAGLLALDDSSGPEGEVATVEAGLGDGDGLAVNDGAAHAVRTTESATREQARRRGDRLNIKFIMIDRRSRMVPGRTGRFERGRCDVDRTQRNRRSFVTVCSRSL
jgi:hypothetical protein